MLSLEQYRILKILVDLQKGSMPFSEFYLYNKSKIFNRPKMLALCRDLQKQGYIDTLVISSTNEILNIRLTYKGLRFLHTALTEVASTFALPIIITVIGGLILALF